MELLSLQEKLLPVKEKEKPVEHDFLFGKWKDFDIDAQEIKRRIMEKGLKVIVDTDMLIKAYHGDDIKSEIYNP